MKYIVYSIVICCFLLSLGQSFGEAKAPADWLKEAFKLSHTAGDEPYTSDLEADDIFQESNAAEGSLKTEGPIRDWEVEGSVGLNDNVMVRFTRWMMRMAIVIAVTMLIFTGIKIALALGDSAKLSEALKNAGMVLLGVFLVLASVAIVYLVSSLMRGSLDYELFN